MWVRIPPGVPEFMQKFKYNGKIYAPADFERKLKALGITANDVELINEDKPKEYIEVKTYTFINKKNGHTIKSIYPNLEDLKDFYEIEDWEYVNDVKC